MLAGTRILVVLGGLEIGGAERQALHLARHLLLVERAEVRVLGLGPPGRTSTLCDQSGIPWHTTRLAWPASRSLKLGNLASFTRVLRRVRPEVILPYTMRPNVACGLTWRLSGARLCIWNQRDEGRHHMGRRAERWAVRQVPTFVSNSHVGAEFLVKAYGLERGQVRVVRNGVQLPPPVADRARPR